MSEQPRKGTLTTDDERERMEVLYKTGEYTIREVAKEIGRSFGTVHRHLADVGLVRSRGEARSWSAQRRHRSRLEDAQHG